MLSGAIQGVPEKSFLYKGQHPEEKKTVVLLDFVQMGGGPCPNFLAPFHVGEGGGGGEGNWTKSKRTAVFFFGKPSLRLNANFDIAIGQKKSVAKGENGGMFIC